jgi:hypothetical protein
MMKQIHATILMVAFLAGCKTEPPCELLPQNNQTMMLMMEAGLYFTVLKDAGVLPEIGKTDHGKLQTMPVVDPSQTAFFPFSAKLGVVMDGKDVVYWYVMQRQDLNSDWDVIKIWKTTKQNEVLAEDLPVPDPPAQAQANVELRKKMQEWRASQQPAAQVQSEGAPSD